jgi:T-complex protein 11
VSVYIFTFALMCQLGKWIVCVRSFRNLVDSLKEPDFIQLTKRTVQRVHYLANQMYPEAPRGLEEINARRFLTSYMVSLYPNNVFDNRGGLENGAISHANQMLENFEGICRSVQMREGSCLKDIAGFEEFVLRLNNYMQKFAMWKMVDEYRMKSKIKNAIIALYRARGLLPANEPADSALNLQFNRQLSDLKNKFVSVFGQEEMDRFELELSTGNITQDPMPPIPPILGRIVDRTMQTNSNPISFSSEQLAHELMLNPEFSIDDSGNFPFYGLLNLERESISNDFWQNIASDLMETPQPSITRVLRVTGEIMGTLLDLGSTTVMDQLRELTNNETVSNLLSVVDPNWQNWKTVVLKSFDAIKLVQTEKRVAETRESLEAFTQSFDAISNEEKPALLVDTFKILLQLVGKLRIDCANARIALIAPVIGDHGVEYEQGKFKDRCLSIEHPIVYVHIFLGNVIGALAKDQDQSVVDWLRANAQNAETSGILDKFICRGLEDIVVHKHDIPETFDLDKLRIEMFRTHFDFHVKSAAILARIYSKSAEIPEGTYRSVAQYLLDETNKAISLEEISAKVQSKLESEGVGEPQIAIVLACTANVSVPLEEEGAMGDPVQNLFKKRISSYLVKYLTNKGPSVQNPQFNAVFPLVPEFNKVCC